MLDDRIGAGEYQARVTVLKPNDVGWLTCGSVDLEDLAHAIGLAHDLAVHVQTVANDSVHQRHLQSVCAALVAGIPPCGELTVLIHTRWQAPLTRLAAAFRRGDAGPTCGPELPEQPDRRRRLIRVRFSRAKDGLWRGVSRAGPNCILKGR
jgi:hypothetical protein